MGKGGKGDRGFGVSERPRLFSEHPSPRFSRHHQRHRAYTPHINAAESAAHPQPTQQQASCPYKAELTPKAAPSTVIQLRPCMISSTPPPSSLSSPLPPSSRRDLSRNATAPTNNPSLSLPINSAPQVIHMRRGGPCLTPQNRFPLKKEEYAGTRSTRPMYLPWKAGTYQPFFTKKIRTTGATQILDCKFMGRLATQLTSPQSVTHAWVDQKGASVRYAT